MKTIQRLALVILLVFALSACWGTDEDDDNETSGGNTLTAIKLAQTKTLRGKYEITEYVETYDNGTIDSDNTTSFLGEMEIETQTTTKTMEYAVSYILDGRNGSASENFTLLTDSSGKLQIDGSKISPVPDEVYDLAVSGSYYLIIEIEGMEKSGSAAKYDLYIEARKMSDDPDYVIP
ncbi:hypothetical protein EP073_13730 [Geovibrio thiophilus]|uniref:Lipocalin-like domain-containing protein n=1 Tax=Geovibrio thiophilus TaxID=139438 RepID=A0A410K1V5_9BACT|nr:hypothetical protein [Geovibrio thiophilus]QAR34420.1 hypothetical protein EP073_13730 [Geovibrio thiophilus]